MILSSIKVKIIEAYGFIADPKLTINHNANIQLGKMLAWYYFDRPRHLAYHDMTSCPTPMNIRSLLGLNLKFCPVPRHTTRSGSEALTRFRKDILVKTYFARRDDDDESDSEKSFDPALYMSKDWSPPEWLVPGEVLNRLDTFDKRIKTIFKKKKRISNNLLRHQTHTLHSIARRPDLIVVNCDKNLGPAVIERAVAIRRVFDDHLHDGPYYKEYTQSEAERHMRRTAVNITNWTNKYIRSIHTEERNFIRNSKRNVDNPFPIFYITLKIHKSPWTTRPIVSCSGSLLYALGVWVDRKLQPIATAQPSYLRSSLDFKSITAELPLLPPGARLFTSDATSFYTNIPTAAALREIGTYLHQHEDSFQGICTDALSEALGIVMKNNVFMYGDTYWFQKSGTAMGTPPAVMYATLFYAIHEKKIVPKYSANLALYKRYIDDIIGIWIPEEDKTEDDRLWSEFNEDLNNFHGIEWITSEREKTINFLDITISIREGRIETTLYEKILNLYLYIPPHSAHPPGVLKGLVLGNCYRIYSLCSDHTDTKKHLQAFYRRLLARGYKPDTLIPLFRRSHELMLDRRVASASAPETPRNNRIASTFRDTRIFFHLQYHPDNPPSSVLQQAWRDCLLEPSGETPLPAVLNSKGYPIRLDQMTVAYSRPPNLGNLLSSRNINSFDGPPASSFKITSQERAPRERERERERVRERVLGFAI